MSIQANTPNTYRLIKSRRLFYGILGLVYLLFCVLFTLGEMSSIQNKNPELFRQICYFPYFILFCLGTSISCLYNFLRARLIVSPDGLEYHASGVDICVKWNEIAGLGSYRWLFYRRTGLSVRSESFIKGWLGALSLPLQTNVRKLIPISMFEQDWQKGEIGLRIKQYAPTLLDE